MSTIGAISTATGEAGIGIIRLSGPEALNILNTMFSSIQKTETTIEDSRLLRYGYIKKEDEILDEVLAVYMKKPHTYTKEDVVEIYCHGGMIPLRRVLDYALELGAEPAEPGEFTKRAFLNGRLDLSQAEAVMDLITSKSKEGYRESLSQLSGSLSEKVRGFRESILEMLAIIVANIDFPEDEVDALNADALIEKNKGLIERIDHLLATAQRGKLLKEGIRTVILGKPNVGKSSLLNALLRENRAIVTDIPGTTRDSIEEYITIDDMVLHLIDTAGIRETEDIIEKIGVDRAKKALDTADLVIALFDVSRKFEDDDKEILKLLENRKSIIILNKWDLPHNLEKDRFEKLLDGQDFIPMSLLEENGVEPLENRLKELFYQEEIFANEDIYLTNIRHVHALKKAKEALEHAQEGLVASLPMDCIEVDFTMAMERLGEITGETIGEDVLDKIFSEFCIGK
ncbi:MAG: tRNA uridine-5-carboxymethylaminomethyl(34) synthesis GTPase MnmE [Tissierellia bacterium]|nr:tRNA uridine-5-carboxymethylaminomethyl(34) synthesis GTPase MnmE [Tissierellia bacterium]